MESQRPDSHKLQLLRQALSAAESSLSLARQLLRELEDQAPPPRPFAPPRGGPASHPVQSPPQSRELPGIVGTFDGTYLTTLDGRKFPVPEGYASKTKLVFGDKLKMIEERGQRNFKQIEPVRRTFANGILSQKEGRFVAVTAGGSYRLLQSSLRYYGGGEGDEVRIILPEGNPHAPFAAIDSIVKKSQVKKEEPPTPAPSAPAEAPSKSAGEPTEEEREKPEREIKPPEKERPPKPKEKKEAPAKEVKKEAKTAKETPKKSSPKKSSADEELR